MMRSLPFPLCVVAMTVGMQFSPAWAQDVSVPDVVDPFVVMGLEAPSNKNVSTKGVTLPRRVEMDVSAKVKGKDTKKTLPQEKKDQEAKKEEAPKEKEVTLDEASIDKKVESTSEEKGVTAEADPVVTDEKPLDIEATVSEDKLSKPEAKEPQYVSRQDAQKAMELYTHQRVRGMGMPTPVLPDQKPMASDEKPEFIKRAEEEAQRAESQAKEALKRAQKAKSEGKVSPEEASALIVPEALIVAPPVDANRGEMGAFLPYLEGETAHGPLLSDLIQAQEAKVAKLEEVPVAKAIPLAKAMPQEPQIEQGVEGAGLESQANTPEQGHDKEQGKLSPSRLVEEAWLKPTLEPAEVPLAPLFNVTPFISTEASILETYPNAKHEDSESLGPRLVILGADLGGDALEGVVSFNEKGLASSFFIKYPSSQYDDVLAVLKNETQTMAPEGIWLEEGGEKVWLTRDAQLRIYPIEKDSFSIEYGPTAPMQRATLAYLMRDPENRLPRLSGFTLGIEGIQSSFNKLTSREGCLVEDPVVLENHEVVIMTKGACFGLPGEKEAQLSFSPETHALTQLEVHFESTPEGNTLIEKAIEKYYEKGSSPGLYQYGKASWRHVLLPSLRLDFKNGFLTLLLYTDGIQKAKAHFEKEKARLNESREAQKQVDALFE